VQGLQIRLERFVLTQASNNYKNRTSSRSGAALAQSEELGKKNKKLKSRQRERVREREGQYSVLLPWCLRPFGFLLKVRLHKADSFHLCAVGRISGGATCHRIRIRLRSCQWAMEREHRSEFDRTTKTPSCWITLRRNFEIPARLFSS
jgi:hypothetical protein